MSSIRVKKSIRRLVSDVKGCKSWSTSAQHIKFSGHWMSLWAALYLQRWIVTLGLAPRSPTCKAVAISSMSWTRTFEIRMFRKLWLFNRISIISLLKFTVIIRRIEMSTADNSTNGWMKFGRTKSFNLSETAGIESKPIWVESRSRLVFYLWWA